MYLQHFSCTINRESPLADNYLSDYQCGGSQLYSIYCFITSSTVFVSAGFPHCTLVPLTSDYYVLRLSEVLQLCGSHIEFNSRNIRDPVHYVGGPTALDVMVRDTTAFLIGEQH